jgi:hypothetical protein
MTCPICGGPLISTASHAQTTPWLCVECHHAWWEAELTEEAHQAFRRSVRDFNYHPGVKADSIIERERALVRSKGSV